MSLSDVTGDYSILTRNSICLFCPQSNGSLGWCQSHKQCAKVISVKITQHFTAAWHKSQHRSITGKHWYACAPPVMTSYIIVKATVFVSYRLGLLYLVVVQKWDYDSVAKLEVTSVMRLIQMELKGYVFWFTLCYTAGVLFLFHFKAKC